MKTLSLCLLILVASEASADEKKVEDSPYFPLKVGTEWHFTHTRTFKNAEPEIKDIDAKPVKSKPFFERSQVWRVEKHQLVKDVPCARISVVVIPKDDKVGKGTPIKPIHIGMSKEGVFVYAVGDLPVRDPTPLLKLPFKSDQSWAGHINDPFEFLVGVGTFVSTEEKIRVNKVEYESIKVVFKPVQKAQNKGQEATFWFAKDIGLVRVERTAPGLTDVIELTKVKK